MKTLNKIFATIKASLLEHLSYLGYIWGGIFVNIVQIMVFYYLWMVVYDGNNSLNGLNSHQIVTYTILARLLDLLVIQGHVNLILKNQIRDGEVVVELIRAFDFELSLYSSRIGLLISATLTKVLPTFVVAGFFFEVMLPHSILNFILFLISIVLGMTIVFFIEFFVGLLSFYTSSGWGLNNLKNAMLTLLSGALVPLTFFPDWFRRILEVLPFKGAVYTPISIYLGLISGTQLYKALLFQVFWVVILLIITRIFYRFSIKNITVQGG